MSAGGGGGGGGECAFTNNILTGKLPLPPVFCHLCHMYIQVCAEKNTSYSNLETIQSLYEITRPLDP